MFLLYRLRLGAPIWPIEVGGPRVLPVWAHSSYATGLETKVVLLEGLCRFFNLFNFLNRRERLDTKVFLLEGLCRFFNLFNFLNRRERLDTKVFLLAWRLMFRNSRRLRTRVFQRSFHCWDVYSSCDWQDYTIPGPGRIPTTGIFLVIQQYTPYRPKTTRTIRVVAAFLLKLAINCQSYWSGRLKTNVVKSGLTLYWISPEMEISLARLTLSVPKGWARAIPCWSSYKTEN